MPLKHLPIGIQTFSKIREGDFVYVDKTKQVYDLASREGAFFLSRPRRFGKSMLVSTFQALFEGKKHLFEGLYIYDKWDWSKTYPVIKIDFAAGIIENRAQLEHRLCTIFEDNQRRLKLNCDSLLQEGDPAGCFQILIQKAYERYNQKVVILIDEYDKPILDNIENLDVARGVREGLKNIYSVMKGQDEYIQFVFMTGVTKFSKVSLFSGINQIKDITLSPNYATICGYTQNDLETTFAEHLAGVNWEKLKEWYNGYSFLGESVYNPYDILLFISEQQLYRSYWFETGSPSFLLKLFKQKRYFLPELEGIEVGEEILDSFDVEDINPVTLLFQAGYLTIDKMGIGFNERPIFNLRVPNKEVKLALSDQFINAYTEKMAHEKLPIQEHLYYALIQGKLDVVESEIKRLFVSIPWRNFTNNELPSTEGYYASVMYAFLSSINARIIPEDITNHGQVDMTIMIGDYVYVMEFKLDKSDNYETVQPNPALIQIEKRGYAQKYIGQNKQLFLVGMIFNKEARNLVQMDWRGV